MNNIVSKVRKTQATCHDCNTPFFLEDAEWCNHYYAVGIGTKKCPNCNNCICHGETAQEIEARFQDNLKKGKFRHSNNPNWRFECIGNKTVEVQQSKEEGLD